MTPDKVAAD